MIRLAWRQFRTQAAVAAGALVVLAVILAVTGPHLVHVYDTTVAPCGARDACGAAADAFLMTFRGLQQSLGALMLIVPAIVGMFWGAPLVARELESGTYRLAWTQSVTRRRWLGAKLAVAGLASMVVAGCLSLMVTWWSSPLDRVAANRFSPGAFDERALVAIGYAAFAFAFGVTAGLLIRRTLPAMASTLVAFVAIRLAFVRWIRPNLMAPLRRTASLAHSAIGFGIANGGPPTLFPEVPRIPNAWVFAPRIVDASGRPLMASFVARTCPNVGVPNHDAGGPARSGVPDAVLQQLRACLRAVGRTYHETVAFQPAGRYWAFQWIETAIFVAAALALAGLCFWLIRRRIS